LAPDFKTIADFRRDNGSAVRKVCSQFVALCRGIDLRQQQVQGRQRQGEELRARKAVSVVGRARCCDRALYGKERRTRRWEHEDILERVQKRLDDDPSKIPLRSKTAEHPFGTIKAWMDATTSR